MPYFCVDKSLEDYVTGLKNPYHVIRSKITHNTVQYITAIHKHPCHTIVMEGIYVVCMVSQ